jgi:hypothetical protein
MRPGELVSLLEQATQSERALIAGFETERMFVGAKYCVVATGFRKMSDMKEFHPKTFVLKQQSLISMLGITL